MDLTSMLDGMSPKPPPPVVPEAVLPKTTA